MHPYFLFSGGVELKEKKEKVESMWADAESLYDIVDALEESGYHCQDIDVLAIHFHAVKVGSVVIVAPIEREGDGLVLDGCEDASWLDIEYIVKGFYTICFVSHAKESDNENEILYCLTELRRIRRILEDYDVKGVKTEAVEDDIEDVKKELKSLLKAIDEEDEYDGLLRHVERETKHFETDLELVRGHLRSLKSAASDER